jgi:hypothetical protein
VPLLAGGLNLFLALYCIHRVGWRAISPNLYALACAASFVAIQVAVHREPLRAGYVNAFTIWMIQLVIIQTLSLRKGFIHRFALVAAVVGVLLLRFLTFDEATDVARAGLEGAVGLANPNDLARWFGFLAVYFLTAGIVNRRGIFVRYVCWGIAVGSSFIVAMTVSRGVIIAVLIGAVVALRHLLRRGFLPLMAFCVLLFVAVGTGVFKERVAAYSERGDEETGRWLVWPLVVEQFLDSPLAGVGVSEIGVYVPDRGIITPHNPFLFLAAGSGILPFGFFVVYWVKAVTATLLARRQRSPDAIFYEPLLTYVAFAIIPENLMFMSHWALVTMSAVLAPQLVGRLQALRKQELVRSRRGLKSGIRIVGFAGSK